MKITLERTNDAFQFETVGKTNYPIKMDNSSEDNAHGVSPMEMILMGVGGCSAIDVVHILKKQRQKITSYKAEVEGNRIEFKGAKPFKNIHVTIYLEGDITDEKALRAAALSFEKYCSVSITLENAVKVSYDVILNGKKL